jgi:predicted transcriptional regulator
MEVIIMAIDPEKQISASVILDKNIYKKVKQIAKENKRSASAQMAFIIEQYINNLQTNNSL